MPRPVNWTEAALADVEQWIAWIKLDSPVQAERVADAVFALAEDIPRHPLTGHILPELRDESLRFKIIHGRRLIYEVRPEVIVIKRLISSKMDFAREYRGGV